MAKIREKTKLEDAQLIIADIEEKDRIIKLDNFLTALNLEDFDIEKIKVISIQDGEEVVDVEYGEPKSNELFALRFKDVDDLKETKMKGLIKGNKFNILLNFAENYIQIKAVYGKGLSARRINKILEKF